MSSPYRENAPPATGEGRSMFGNYAAAKNRKMPKWAP